MEDVEAAHRSTLVSRKVQEMVDRYGPDAMLLGEEAFLARAELTSDEMREVVARKGLFHVDVEQERLYPAFYADASLDRGQLELITSMLGDRPPGAKFLFFMTPKGSCARLSDGAPRTPLQAMRDGELSRAMTAAEGFVGR